MGNDSGIFGYICFGVIIVVFLYFLPGFFMINPTLTVLVIAAAIIGAFCYISS